MFQGLEGELGGTRFQSELGGSSQAMRRIPLSDIAVCLCYILISSKGSVIL